MTTTSKTYDIHVDAIGGVHKISTSENIYKVELYLTPEQWDRLSKWSLTQPMCPDDPEEGAWLGLFHHGNAREEYIKHVKNM